MSDERDLGRVEQALRSFGRRAREAELFEPPEGLAAELHGAAYLARRRSVGSWTLAVAAALLVGATTLLLLRDAQPARPAFVVALATSPEPTRSGQVEFSSGERVHVHVAAEQSFRGALAMLDSAGTFALLPDERGRTSKDVSAGASVPWIVELDDQAGDEALFVLTCTGAFDEALLGSAIDAAAAELASLAGAPFSARVAAARAALERRAVLVVSAAFLHR